MCNTGLNRVLSTSHRHTARRNAGCPTVTAAGRARAVLTISLKSFATLDAMS